MATSSHSTRRLGSHDSATRARLVDAAEQLLVEEGYAAVTSRRVASRADLKPQLVHYYFRTMDDLFLEVFRRSADANLARLRRAIDEDGSLRGLWALAVDARAAAFSAEFVALANHRKAIRSEVARYAEEFRQAQLDAVAAALARLGIGEDRVPPVVALLAITGMSQIMALEGVLGVTTGHDETRDFVDDLLVDLERRSR